MQHATQARWAMRHTFERASMQQATQARCPTRRAFKHAFMQHATQARCATRRAFEWHPCSTQHKLNAPRNVPSNAYPCSTQRQLNAPRVMRSNAHHAARKASSMRHSTRHQTSNTHPCCMRFKLHRYLHAMKHAKVVNADNRLCQRFHFAPTHLDCRCSC